MNKKYYLKPKFSKNIANFAKLLSVTHSNTQ